MTLNYSIQQQEQQQQEQEQQNNCVLCWDSK